MPCSLRPSRGCHAPTAPDARTPTSAHRCPTPAARVGQAPPGTLAVSASCGNFALLRYRAHRALVCRSRPPSTAARATAPAPPWSSLPRWPLPLAACARCCCSPAPRLRGRPAARFPHYCPPRSPLPPAGAPRRPSLLPHPALARAYLRLCSRSSPPPLPCPAFACRAPPGPCVALSGLRTPRRSVLRLDRAGASQAGARCPVPTAR
nr:vegetative cell wall protein gp1-like [Aegilops tauschii subsp. strangulata]